MTEQSQPIRTPFDTTLQRFHDLANTNTPDSWQQYDALVDTICNDDQFLAWTSKGIRNAQDEVSRDLAISILEKTQSPLFDEVQDDLRNARDTDQNLHLRRKAAIALAVHGDKSESTVTVLKDAFENDDELQEQAEKLLNS